MKNAPPRSPAWVRSVARIYGLEVAETSDERQSRDERTR